MNAQTVLDILNDEPDLEAVQVCSDWLEEHDFPLIAERLQETFGPEGESLDVAHDWLRNCLFNSTVICFTWRNERLRLFAGTTYQGGPPHGTH